jgi:hypothetical protein
MLNNKNNITDKIISNYEIESKNFKEIIGNTQNNINKELISNQLNKINYVHNNTIDTFSDNKDYSYKYISNKNLINYKEDYNNQKNNYIDINQIGLTKGFEKKDDIYKDEFLNKKNNTRITRINIDSRFRNIEPKNILDNIIYTLPKDPLYFIKDSNIVTIYHPKHTFNIGDKIIIQNIKPNKIYLKPNCLEFIQGSTYIKIKHQSHGLDNINTSYYILINNIIGTTDKSHIGNIPINIINKNHKIILKRNDNDVINGDYYYIDISINIINNITYDTTIPFIIELLNINGIHINKLNANYPLSSNQLQGYHIISKIYNDCYQITLNDYATKTTYQIIDINKQTKILFNINLNQITLPFNYDNNKHYGGDFYFGGNGINIAKIIDVIDGYPNPNYYIISLKKTYYNVKKIKLISSEFPNTEKVIKSQPINIKNNSLYWQILQDGDTIYSIDIDDGSYTMDTFISELTYKIQQIQRKNLVSNLSLTYATTTVNTYINPYHAVKISINQASSLFSITMYNETILERPFIKSQRIYPDTFIRLTILHPKHFLNINDQIVISNSSSTEGIPASIINGTYLIESIISPDSYEIRLPKYNVLSNLDQTFGGTAVSIKLPIDFRLLFDRQDTIGKVLGFKNIGSSNSITPYFKTITNQIKYENDIIYNSVGQINYQKNIINLSGESYILMCCPIFTNSISTDNAENVFAKIQLSGPPDTILYNQHIQIIEDPIEIIPSLSDIEFKFVTSNNELFYFNNIEHSFTLEIHEDLS